jgi:hypothetical protein
MPFNYRKTASLTPPEILRFPAGLDAQKSVVLDANDATSFPVPADSGTRYQVAAGTILTLATSPAPAAAKLYKVYAGSGTIQGILGRNVDMVVNTTQGMEAANMFFHGCVFATEAIVGFTLYASALINDLKYCQFA